MRILVAPDSFKECLSAAEVARVISEEVQACHADAAVMTLPLSDGGEGFSAIVAAAMKAERIPVTVTGPLGEPVEANYFKTGDIAILEAASACGLSLVPLEKRNPLRTTSRGVGEMIRHAHAAGCRHFVMGLGGTSTCDGGEGMMAALNLAALKGKVSVQVLCDVDNPFIGRRGAARVFGPQKGATPDMVEMLEERMRGRADVILAETGVDVRELPGAGAAGGLGGALAACLGGTLVPGIDAILDLLHFDELVRDCDLVITGEGKSDRQTLSGKVPYGVLRHAGAVPVVLLSGRVSDRDSLLEAGFARVIQVSPDEVPTRVAIRPEVAEANLRNAVRLVFT